MSLFSSGVVELLFDKLLMTFPKKIIRKRTCVMSFSKWQISASLQAAPEPEEGQAAQPPAEVRPREKVAWNSCMPGPNVG